MWHHKDVLTLDVWLPVRGQPNFRPCQVGLLITVITHLCSFHHHMKKTWKYFMWTHSWLTLTGVSANRSSSRGLPPSVLKYRIYQNIGKETGTSVDVRWHLGHCSSILFFVQLFIYLIHHGVNKTNHIPYSSWVNHHLFGSCFINSLPLVWMKWTIS